LRLGFSFARLAAALRPRAATQPTPVVSIAGDEVSLALLRRTVPALRSRRPEAAVEAQVRWRQAGKLRRKLRVVS
jgi:hypothetical protein